MTAYYNEFNPDKAEVLRNMIDAGLIAAGDVDTRRIEDVKPSDIRGYKQCHFFAGIGIWPLGLRETGRDTRPGVWTGSCPCQPFSAAGKGDGFDDERHLWPHWQWLIAQCRPDVVYAEQVATKDGLAWLDLVQADMEGTGYAGGFLDLCAAGFGAPHIRQRLYGYFEYGIVGNADQQEFRGEAGRCDTPETSAGNGQRGDAVGSSDTTRIVADCHVTGLQGLDQRRDGTDQRPAGAADMDMRTMPTNGYWRDADWVWCRDSKWRPVEPGASPLAHGLPRGLGTADTGVQILASMAGLDAASLRDAKRHRKVAIMSYGDGIVLPQAVAFINATP